jgi:GTP:adenosylcobinamide-phosphate guanylyltransferase
MKNLTLVIPAKNEEENLIFILNELKNINCKKIIIVNKINKKIKNIKKKFKIRIIKQSSNGYGNAIIQGIKNVKTELMAIFNADGSFDPKFLSNIKKNNLKKKFLLASRYEKNGKSDDDTIVTYIGNKIFTFLGNLLFNLKITDILYTYIIGKTSNFKILNLQSSDFRLCVEIPIEAKKKHFFLKSLPSYERSRISGKKNVNELKDGLLILFYLIKNYLFKFIFLIKQ